MNVFNVQELNDVGLNLHAVFNLSELPITITDQIKSISDNYADYSQLILVGNLGRRLWDCVNSPSIATNLLIDPIHPIDSFSVAQIKQHIQANYAGLRFEFLYPSAHPIGLQHLGEIAGWHHASPFKVGINQAWGSWFAYRAALLVNSDFAVSAPVESSSPCEACSDKPCISACPANAMRSGELEIKKCLTYRGEHNSLCANKCLARIACPVAVEYRYSLKQINYHYSQSLPLVIKNSKT